MRPLPHTTTALLPATLCALFAACAPPSARGPNGAHAPSKPTAVFTTRAELARVPAKPAPPEAFSDEAVLVPEWTVPVPSREALARYDDPSALGEMVRAIAAKRPSELTTSPELRCAATEIARVAVEKGGEPTAGLRGLIAGACGATSSVPAVLIWHGKAGASTRDEEILKAGRPKLEEALAKHTAQGRHTLGAAFARRGERFAAVAMVGTDQASVDPSSRVVDASRRAIVRGELRTPAASAIALVNRGDYGWSPCAPHPSASLPAFAFTCEMADRDASAWVQVLVRKSGHLLLESVADVLLRKEDATNLSYRSPAGTAGTATGTPAKSAEDLTAALVEQVNEVRRRGRMTELSMAPRQTAENTRVAGTLTEATLHGDAALADRIALGLLAGWEVDGMIRNGAFFAGDSPSRDPKAWLDIALAQPLGRMVLLDPDARQIAIGGVVPPGARGLGAVVTTYSMFESFDHSADVRRLLQRVAEARGARKLPPIRWIDMPELAEAAAGVAQNDEPPMAALDRAMQHVAARTQAMVHGVVLEGNDLEHGEIPDLFLTAGSPDLGIHITHHRAPGGAWGQYVVFAVFVTPYR